MADVCQSLSGLLMMPERLFTITEKVLALNYASQKRIKQLTNILKDLLKPKNIDCLNGISVEEFLCYCTRNYRKLVEPIEEKVVKSPNKQKRSSGISAISLMAKEWGDLAKHKKQVDHIKNQKELNKNSIKIKSAICDEPIYSKELDRNLISELTPIESYKRMSITGRTNNDTLFEEESESDLCTRLQRLEQLVNKLQIESKENTKKISYLLADNDKLREALKKATKFLDNSTYTPKKTTNEVTSMSKILTSVHLSNKTKQSSIQREQVIKFDVTTSVLAFNTTEGNFIYKVCRGTTIATEK